MGIGFGSQCETYGARNGEIPDRKREEREGEISGSGAAPKNGEQPVDVKLQR